MPPAGNKKGWPSSRFAREFHPYDKRAEGWPSSRFAREFHPHAAHETSLFSKRPYDKRAQGQY